MKRIALSLVALCLLLAACNKDQRTVNHLDGEWTIDRWVQDGQNIVLDRGTMEFEKCKQKDGECDGELDYTDTFLDIFGNTHTQTTIHQLRYKVSEDGERMTLTVIEDGHEDVLDVDLKLDGDNLELDWQEGSVVTKMELTRS